jgi:arylsulfatase A-like enzyme
VDDPVDGAAAVSPNQRRTRWTSLWVHFGLALDSWICGSFAWLCVLSLEIDAGHPEPERLLIRGLFLLSLACQYSALFCIPLSFVHALRRALVARGWHADRWMMLLLAIALAVPSYRQAELLTTGGLLLDSEFAAHARLVLLSVLLSANLLLWQLHLLLIRAPGYTPLRPIASLMRRTRGWPGVLASALWLIAGVAILRTFAVTVDQGLRAYVFLSQFLLPSAWLFATTLLFALQMRLRWPRSWQRAIGAGVLLAGLCAAGFAARDVRRAKAEFERRGGTVALTGLAVSIQRGAPYANLDISRPARFHCPPPQAAYEPATLPAPEAARRHVILISIDTLRKDALSLRLAGKPAAPVLQALAAKSLSFERAVTTYPATLFALSSALTGQSPSEVLFAPKPPNNLFTQTRQLFREQLIALPSATWFRRPPVPELLTQAALPTFWPNAERSTTWMIHRLRQARALQHRTFAWIHYFEPHTSEVSGRGRVAEQNAKQSYASLVNRVDQQLGRLLQALEILGYLNDSLLIVFSDHGEALGELDYFGHHVYLNQFATDVPLLVHAPGLAARRSERLVLLSDIAPTVLEWIGSPAAAGDARSLFSEDHAERYGMSEAFPVRGRALYEVARVPITNAETLAQRMQLIRTAAIDYQPKVSLVSSRYRLIVNRETGAEEFYDRVQDPNEEHELSQDGLAVQHDMREALRKLQLRLSERIYCRVVDRP